MLSKQQIKEHARAFILWREATSVNWQCTVAELARACGMNLSTVQKLSERRGWRLINGNDGHDRSPAIPVDRRMTQ